jgi:arylsulfatase A-like enzyme/Flp pilus assembly protein TadD
MGRGRAKRDGTHSSGPPPNARSGAWPAVIGLVVLALAVAVGLRVSRRPPAAAGEPGKAPLSVLLVTLDTTRADRLGCYGYAAARTSRLDRLAAEGVRFANAFADAPITLPSHASLLTGLHPFEHGVRNNGNFHLPDRFETLATVLGRRGYRTAAFVSAFVLDRRYGLARGFQTYDDRTDPGADGEGAEAQRRGDRTALACSRWLEAYAGGGAKAPFFVWLHLYDPHEPYRPPPPLRDAFAGRPYDGEIAFADTVVGSVLDRLGQLGLLDTSLIAVVADHGESLGDHGEETHSMFVYDSAIRVPLILWRPGLLPGGRVVASPVRMVDVAPTILDLLGAPPLAARRARSLRGTIDGRDQAAPPVYAETWVPKLYMNGAALRALRTERFKLIEAPRPELYDLARDPGETDNRIAADPETASRLRAELQRLTAGGDAAMSLGGPVDGEAAEKLKALGYLGAGGDLAGPAPGGQEKDPKDLIADFNRLRRAEQAVRDGRFDEAVPVLRALVAQEPKNAFARLVLGGAYAGLRQHARAAEQLQAYVALVPTSAHGHQSLAVAYAKLGDSARALREAASAVALDPRLTDARLLRAGILAGQGRRADVLRELRAGVAAAPDQPALRMSLAEVLLEGGNAKDAESEYRAILGPDAVTADDGRLRAEARFGLAVALERQGRGAEARSEYEQVARAAEAPRDVQDAARKKVGGAP